MRPRNILSHCLLVGAGGSGGDQTLARPQAWLHGPQLHVRTAHSMLWRTTHSMLRDDRPCRDFATTCYDTSLSIQTRPLLPLRFGSHEFTPHRQVYVGERSPRSTHSSLLTCPQTRVPAPSVLGPCPVPMARYSANTLNCSSSAPESPRTLTHNPKIPNF